MDAARSAMEETITLKQAKKLVQCMAHEQSFLLLSPPGVGKSEMVYQAAKEVGTARAARCSARRSRRRTSAAFRASSASGRCSARRACCCPRTPEPFCLFLDELPACAPDVQKAFYSLLLERRLGEHALPEGTWVVAAGNRQQDRALVRSMSSALVNRVTILHLRVDADEWQEWARAPRRPRRNPQLHFLHARCADAAGAARAGAVLHAARLGAAVACARHGAERPAFSIARPRRALAFGRLSAEDAAVFCALAEEAIGADAADRVLHRGSRDAAEAPRPRAGSSSTASARTCATASFADLKPRAVNRFLRSLPPENQLTLLTDLVEQWGALGADRAMLELLKKVTEL